MTKVIDEPTVVTVPLNKQFLDSSYVGKFKPADATPSVANLNKFIAGNTIANNVTDFTKGQEGQDISILGDGFTTVVHNVAKLVTNTAANKLLAAAKIYRFTRINKVWYEDA